jgi:hypothetical protein
MNNDLNLIADRDAIIAMTKKISEKLQMLSQPYNFLPNILRHILNENALYIDPFDTGDILFPFITGGGSHL